MKPNYLFTSLLAVTALFVASCSTPRMAEHNAIQDDVYNTTAQAKEYIAPAPRPEPIQYQDEATVADDSYYGNSDPYYDMDYSSRIDRFYYASPWRSYFGYNDFYGYNSFYSPYSFGLGGFYGNVYNYGFNSYLNWGLYGAPYYSNFWGPYSWYNPYGGFYGGGFGGGYYGGGFVGRGTNANYSPRPSRGSENGVGRANGTYMGGGSSRANGTNANGNTSVGRSRAEMYNPATSGSTRPSRGNGNTSNAPTRSEAPQSRPTRSNDAPQQSRPTYNPPAQSSPPPSSRGGGSSSSSGGGGGGGGRPTRGGR